MSSIPVYSPRVRQSGGFDPSTVMRKVRSSVGGIRKRVKSRAVDAIATRAKRYLNKAITSRVKNKKAQGFLRNQVNAAVPYIKNLVQKGSGIRRQQRRKRRPLRSKNATEPLF